MDSKISIVIPAKNEAKSLDPLLSQLKSDFQRAEIILVNDGSTDNTSDICKKHKIIECKHPYSKGNGAAIKTGARRATRDIIVFMDGDGQHKPEEIPKLVNKLLGLNYDMAVGARSSKSQANIGRLTANTAYNRLASLMVGHTVEDLTSGFRAVNAEKFKKFLHLLPNGFSYPTTITMAFFRAGYSVSYEAIHAEKRVGKSHINLMKDGTRFLLIIFKVGTLYSPLKIFIPISGTLFMLGLARYYYTYTTSGTFTNMSTLLLITSLIIFLIGLVSEQITTLIYQTDQANDKNQA